MDPRSSGNCHPVAPYQDRLPLPARTGDGFTWDHPDLMVMASLVPHFNPLRPSTLPHCDSDAPSATGASGDTIVGPTTSPAPVLPRRGTFDLTSQNRPTVSTVSTSQPGFQPNPGDPMDPSYLLGAQVPRNSIRAPNSDQDQQGHLPHKERPRSRPARRRSQQQQDTKAKLPFPVLEEGIASITAPVGPAGLPHPSPRTATASTTVGEEALPSLAPSPDRAEVAVVDSSSVTRASPRVQQSHKRIPANLMIGGPCERHPQAWERQSVTNALPCTTAVSTSPSLPLPDASNARAITIAPPMATIGTDAAVPSSDLSDIEALPSPPLPLTPPSPKQKRPIPRAARHKDKAPEPTEGDDGETLHPNTKRKRNLVSSDGEDACLPGRVTPASSRRQQTRSMLDDEISAADVAAIAQAQRPSPIAARRRARGRGKRGESVVNQDEEHGDDEQDLTAVGSALLGRSPSSFKRDRKKMMVLDDDDEEENAGNCKAIAPEPASSIPSPTPRPPPKRTAKRKKNDISKTASPKKPSSKKQEASKKSKTIPSAPEPNDHNDNNEELSPLPEGTNLAPVSSAPSRQAENSAQSSGTSATPAAGDASVDTSFSRTDMGTTPNGSTKRKKRGHSSFYGQPLTAVLSASSAPRTGLTRRTRIPSLHPITTRKPPRPPAPPVDLTKKAEHKKVGSSLGAHRVYSDCDTDEEQERLAEEQRKQYEEFDEGYL